MKQCTAKHSSKLAEVIAGRGKTGNPDTEQNVIHMISHLPSAWIAKGILSISFLAGILLGNSIVVRGYLTTFRDSDSW